MKNMIERKRITEWIVRGLPVLLVAVIWGGIWMMWPDPQPAAAKRDIKPFKVVFVSNVPASGPVIDPASFAFDSLASFRPSSLASPNLLRMPAMHKGPKQFLGIGKNVLNARPANSVAGWSLWDRKDADFRSVFSDALLFAPREPSPQMVVMLTDNLKEAGFNVPAFADDELLKRLPGWEARVMVDLDKEGLPQHVLIEKGSGNRDIDAIICRQILLGRAGSKKETRGGRVTVSYGLE